MNPLKIVIIGAGNTATVLGRKLKNAGHEIVQVFGRNSMDASALAYDLDTESTNYWNIVNRDADLYLIAVSDIAISEIREELRLPEAAVVHTAASVPMQVLQGTSEHYGVFYPLQSMRKELRELPDVPIIIDGSDDYTLQLLRSLGDSISNRVERLSDQQRMKLHLAAVFCNNFVNHLYTVAEDYCREENLDFSLLLPLISETAERLHRKSPSELQTGPAVRNDMSTMDRHLGLLHNHPEMAEIYRILSSSIIRRGK